MKTLHAFIKTKFILLALFSASSVIIATTIPFEFNNGKEPLPNETGGSKRSKNYIQPTPPAANSKIVFAVAVNQVTPRSGTVLGGTAVIISGSGFTPPNAVFTVKFNGADATSVVRVSNSVITAITPAHVAGTVSVTVGINGEETTTENLFTYVCSDPSTIIFTESIGSVPPGPPVSIADHEIANAFDNDNYTMSGTGEIRSTPVSTGYLGASDGANVFLTNVPGTYFRIDGINASGYANPELSFGLFKNNTASNGNDLVVEVSGDGISFTSLNFPPLPTGAGTTVWHYRIAAGTIPLSPNLSIRFRQDGSSTQYRIDDIRLISSPPITSHPSSIVSCLASLVSFSVTATGNGLTYQWRKNGIEINGATASSYSIPSVEYNDAGSYDVIVKETCTGLFTISNPALLSFDLTPPAIIASGTTLTLACNPSILTLNGALGSASATDNCGSPTITRSDGPIQSSGCNRSQTRTFTATDGTGNTATAARTVTWTADVTPPVFIGSYATVILSCNPAAASITAALDGATASDACSTPTLISGDGPVISTGCNRSQTRTFRATDACGNTSTVSRTVTWTTDITPPVFTGIYGTIAFLGCNPGPGDVFQGLGFATASDACGVPTITFVDIPVFTGCNRFQIRTFTATDACGNTASVSNFAIWTEDVTPPSFTGSYATVNLGCNPAAFSITAALDGATASDACSTPILTTSDGPIISNGCNRSQTRTFTAIDGCGNISTVSRTVNWFTDITPPLLTISGGSLNLGCNPDPEDINAALGIATAFDACAATTLVTNTGAVVTSGCNRAQTRTFTAMDACGNFASASRTAIWTVDITPPVFIGSYGTINLGCNPAAFSITAALDGATASDACATPILTTSDGPIISNGCNRSQTRTFTAIDGCGNISTVSRTVNWYTDITPPLLTISGGSLNLGCNPDPEDINAALGVATAFDACAATSLVTNTGPVVTSGCNRAQTRTFTAMDACGNFSSASRTAIWTVDITPPVFIGSYGTINLGCNPAVFSITAALDGATASDACATPILTTSDGPIISNGCNRSQTRTFTAIDGCGNISTVSRTVNWYTDITPPLLTISGGSLNLGCNPGPEDIDAALGVATAFDACAATSLVTNTGPVVTSGCNRAQTRTFTAMDACGNFASASRTVIWVADPPPVFIGDYVTINLGCNPSAFSINAALDGATASDACSTPTLVATDGAVISNGCTRSQTRTFFAFDACGNTSTASRTVNWVADIIPPVFIGDYSTVVLGPDPDPGDISAALGIAIASDACGSPLLRFSDGPVISNDCDRSQTRTFTATDACGNFAWISRTVVWTCGQTRVNPIYTNKFPKAPPFNVKAYPNPTEHQFTLYLEGASNEKVQIVVYDAIGRQVKKIERGDATSGAIKFGEDLKVGAYIVEVRQGVNRKTIKLVKQ